MNDDDAEKSPLVKRHDELVDRIRVILHGQHPDVVGPALADLAARFLVGHPDFMRDRMLALHVRAVLAFIPIAEHSAFGPEGHPHNRGRGRRRPERRKPRPKPH